MLKYLLLGEETGILATRKAQDAAEGVRIALPDDSTLFWNGRAYPGKEGVVTIPRGNLRVRNTVRILNRRGSFRCEGVGYDGESVTPLGYDRDAVLLAIGSLLTEALDTLDDLAAWVLAEKQARSISLFS